MSDIKELASAISKLTRDRALNNRIKFLEREVVRLTNTSIVTPNSCNHELHIESLRLRNKELESKNQKLTNKLESIRAKAVSD